jgi:hypothetical protein
LTSRASLQTAAGIVLNVVNLGEAYANIAPSCVASINSVSHGLRFERWIKGIARWHGMSYADRSKPIKAMR